MTSELVYSIIKINIDYYVNIKIKKVIGAYLVIRVSLYFYDYYVYIVIDK